MLENSIYQLFPNFKNHFPEELGMSEDEKRVCWMTIIKLTNAEEAKLLTKSPQAIISTKSRLFTKITKKNGTVGDFYSLIDSI